jgi:hypothetical protein
LSRLAFGFSGSAQRMFEWLTYTLNVIEPHAHLLNVVALCFCLVLVRHTRSYKVICPL